VLEIEKAELKYLNGTFRPNVETCLGTSGHLSKIGLKAKENWEEIPQHFPFVQLDKFEVMPNHIHGILVFHENNQRKPGSSEFKSQVGKLGTIINLF